MRTITKNLLRVVGLVLAGVAMDVLSHAAPLRIELAGPSVLTNECHTPYVEPGLWIKGAPVTIVAGVAHCVGLKADGTVLAWGLHQMGQTNVPPDLGRAIAVAAHGSFSLAVTEAGAVVGWGEGPKGELNIPPTAQQDVVAVAAGRYHALALKADGTLVGWGFNTSGQTTIPPSATNVVAIEAGQQHSLALRANGTAVAWGANFHGEGDVPAFVTNVVAIAAGHSHNLALRADGSVVTWGYDGAFNLLRVPPRATNVIAIAAQDHFSVAVRADGSVVTWGFDHAARITVIPAGATNVIGVAAGGESYFADFCLAWKTDGSTVGWGANSWGQTTAPADLSLLDLPSYVTGHVDTQTPGVYTLTYTTTNILGEVATASRSVAVVDTTPPELNCPTNRVVELEDMAGATVYFNATATDLCAGTLPTTFVPQSGSRFPIGTNLVLGAATDASGNVAQCSFTVTVLGPRTIKMNVLAEMRAVADGQTIPLLAQAIRSLTRTVTAEWWQDELQLTPRYGARVFSAEAETVVLLNVMLQQRHSRIPNATLLDWINRLVKVDRLLALREVELATAAGFPPRLLVRANELVADGDKAARHGNYALAILFYEHAWSIVVRPPNRPVKHDEQPHRTGSETLELSPAAEATEDRR